MRAVDTNVLARRRPLDERAKMSPFQIVFISSGITLSGVLLAAVIAGVYNLRAKQNEYVNDYYKR